MAPDVFFCSCARNGLRAKVAATCFDILAHNLGHKPKLLRTWGAALRVNSKGAVSLCPDEEFQLVRRQNASVLAQTDPYLIADDDCIPIGKNWLENGAEILMDYPEFAALALLPINCNIMPWTPEDYTPFMDEEVMETVSCGSMYFMRRDVMKDWPEGGKSYDKEQAEYLRSIGRRVGYLRNIKMFHVCEGHGLSTVWA